MAKTRSGLVPAKIVNLTTHEEVNCMFNPQQYTITKTNSWAPNDAKGKNTPLMKFQSGGAATLNLDLWFDSYPEGTDVREHTDMLWKMMKVDPSSSSSDASANKSAPPTVSFEWGKLKFQAVITNLNQNFSLFKADGTPLRTKITVALTQMVDEDDFKPQPGSWLVFESSKVVTMSTDLRLDNIAASISGSSSAMRAVAEANNIEDPKKIANGVSLVVPKVSVNISL